MTMTEARQCKPMRVLAIHRYYWPDTPPYASMLRAIAARWAADGHRVDVLSSQPSYKRNTGVEKQPAEQTLDGVKVRRLDLPSEHGRPMTRLANVARLAWAIVWQAKRQGPYDVIMASTAPPVFIGAAARIAARLTGARFIYHCMDIHPEIGRISGEFRNPIVFSLLRIIDASNCKAATRVIVLSRDMEQAVRRRRGTADASVCVINNFNLPSFSNESDASIPDELQKPPGRFRLLFAGNIGRFQGLEAVVDAMHRLSSRPEVELIFLGEGRAVDALKSRAGTLLGNQIKFFPHQPIDVARAVIRTADLCLVTLTPGIYRFAFPSKTMTYLGEGRPLLVSVEPDSELAEFVNKENVGTAVAPNEPEALVSAIAELADNPARQQDMALKASRIGNEKFEQSVVLERWSSLMRELAIES